MNTMPGHNLFLIIISSDCFKIRFFKPMDSSDTEIVGYNQC